MELDFTPKESSEIKMAASNGGGGGGGDEPGEICFGSSIDGHFNEFSISDFRDDGQ